MQNTLLKNQSDEFLISRLKTLARTERKITHRILLYINEIDLRKSYAPLGFSSMFEFLCEHFGYSESAAYRRLQAARLLRNIPEAAAHLESGELNLTQMSQVQNAVKQKQKDLKKTFGIQKFSLTEQTKNALDKIHNKTQAQTQIILAQEFDQPLKQTEKTSFQKDESLRLEVTFTKEQASRLGQVKALLSHQNSNQSWSELIMILAEKELNRRLGTITSIQRNVSPERKQYEVSQKRKEYEATPEPKQYKTPLGQKQISKRDYIPIALKRDLFKKAGFTCQYIDSISKKRCISQHFLEIEHQIPLAMGGDNSPKNLRIFCRTHNALAAREWGIATN